MPAASGATAVQSTWANTANSTAEVIVAAPTTMFFSALAVTRAGSAVSSSSASSSTPEPAPKYPL